MPIQLPKSRPTNADLKAFEGTWRKVSGEGPKEIVVSRAGPADLDIWDSPQKNSGNHAFENINGGPSEPEKYIAGLVSRQYFSSEATLENGKLEGRHTDDFHTGLFHGFIPTRVEHRQSLELKDGKLTYENEEKMLHRELLWAGPYGSSTTGPNTTDLVNPSRPLQRGEYVRED